MRAILLSGWLLLSACGAEDVFIGANVERGDDCEYSPDLDNAIARVEFDIAAGASEESEACLRPFLAHFSVENPNSSSALVEEAEIKLMDVQRRTIAFNKAEQSLPNPFLVAIGSSVASDSSGVVALEAIPVEYAAQLEKFAGKELVISAQLFGKTSGGSEFESNAFTFQVALCDGCRTLCASDPASADVGECSGPEPGADREFCIDESC